MIDLASTPRVNLRIDEFCEIMGVSRRTVYNWCKWGWIGFVYIGSERRIPIQETRDLAAGRKQLPTKTRKMSQPVQPQALSA